MLQTEISDSHSSVSEYLGLLGHNTVQIGVSQCTNLHDVISQKASVFFFKRITFPKYSALKSFTFLSQKLYIIRKLSKVIFKTRMHTYTLQILSPDLMKNITSNEQINNMCAVSHLEFCKRILLRKSNCQYHVIFTCFLIAFSCAAQRETHRRQQSIELC